MEEGRKDRREEGRKDGRKEGRKEGRRRKNVIMKGGKDQGGEGGGQRRQTRHTRN